MKRPVRDNSGRSFEPNSSQENVQFRLCLSQTAYFRKVVTFTEHPLPQIVQFNRPNTFEDRTLLMTVHFRKPPTSSRLDHFSLLTFYSDVTRHALRICILGALTKIVSYWAFIDTQFTILICNCTFPIIKTFSRSRYFSSVT